MKRHILELQYVLKSKEFGKIKNNKLHGGNGNGLGWEAEKKRRCDDAIVRNAADVIKVKESGIDFTKFGWVRQVAKLINKHPQKINGWVKKYAPEIYECAFKKK